MKSTALLFAAAMIVAPMQAQSGQWEVRLVGYHSGRQAPLRSRLLPRRRPLLPAEAVCGGSTHHDATRVYAYERREERLAEEAGHSCREIRRAVGDQHLTVDGAKKAANDAWAGAVRFHLGEKYMDLSNARHIVYTCSRSSIKEGGVTTLGQSLTRCEVEAQPCHPAREIEASSKER